jgi:hypothetical protein
MVYFCANRFLLSFRSFNNGAPPWRRRQRKRKRRRRSNFELGRRNLKCDVRDRRLDTFSRLLFARYTFERQTSNVNASQYSAALVLVPIRRVIGGNRDCIDQGQRRNKAKLEGRDSIVMSLYTPKRPFVALPRNVAMGHERPPAPQKNSQPFRRRSTVKSVTDLPVGACYRSQ